MEFGEKIDREIALVQESLINFEHKYVNAGKPLKYITTAYTFRLMDITLIAGISKGDMMEFVGIAYDDAKEEGLKGTMGQIFNDGKVN